MKTNRKRVLVVDDDGEIRQLLRAVLDARGFDVELASDGFTMRSVLTKARIDLVVIDALLRFEHGVDLANHVGSLGIPTIMISGDPSQFDAIKRTNYAFMTKPLRIKEFMTQVSTMTKGAASAAAKPPVPPP
jgi:two-component system OmpR family response regulator